MLHFYESGGEFLLNVEVENAETVWCGGALALSLYLKEKKSEGQMHRGP
jgi:hypothetical protein